MTDKDAPEKPAKSVTPGMEEVSAKFVHEAEAAASTDEALSALWQEHERLTAQYEEATRQYGAAETALQAITKTETSEYDTAAPAAEDAGQWQRETSDAVVAAENRMAKMPARTVAGALLKLRVAGADIAGEHRGRYGVLDETQMNSVERLTLSALADLERLAGTAVIQEPEIDALFNEWRKQEDRYREIRVETTAALQRIPPEIQAKHEAHQGGPASDPDYHEHYVACGADALDDESDRVCDKIADLQKQIIKTPVRTWGGLLTKAHVAWHITALDSELDELRPDLSSLPGLDDAIFVWAVFQDAQRLAGEAVPIDAASVTEDPVLVLRQRWENVRASREQLKHRDGDDPKHPDVIEDERLGKVELDIEELIANAPTHTAAGVAIKLRQLQTDDEEFDGMFPWRQAAFKTALEALGQGIMPISAAGMVEDPVLALKREWEGRYKLLDEDRDDPNTDDSDEAVQPFYDRLHETEVQILRTQATTPAGIAIKLILWARLHCNTDEVSGLSWTRKSIEGDPHDLDRLPVLSALLDLESMSSGAVVPEAPAASDAALIDAIAEFDRLIAIEQELKHRTEIFRPNIPEEAEANKVYEAACDETLKAWKRVRKIPATTHAGLIARLQAADRWLTALGEVEPYPEDWCIIKADVRRIAGEG